ncbi:YaiI/YqxD family protein [Rhodovulum sp. DZ06]|uniref:YaiI/YqxD family protein n=1 Tax=Rhodovulum sp. DZ06 TaxID=3425126 RepID=UPI003D3548F6
MSLSAADFPTTGPRVLVDADACPVKEEVQKVCFRLKIPMIFIANGYLRLPQHPLVALEVVGSGFDAADDRVVERCATGPGAVAITQDILLADRCLKEGAAAVLSPKGVPFTEGSIGGAVATRAIMEDLRAGAGVAAEGMKGQAPFSNRDRAQFLQALDTALQKVRRGR